MAPFDSPVPLPVRTRALHRQWSAPVAAWLTAFGQGEVSQSDCCSSLVSATASRQSLGSRDHESHRVVDSEGTGHNWHSAISFIVEAIGTPFRSYVLLPRHGDSRGLSEHLAESIDAGVAVVCQSRKGSALLIPESSVDDTMTWLFRLHNVDMTAEVPFISDADKGLRRSILDTDSELNELDLIPQFENGRAFVQDDGEYWARTHWPTSFDAPRRLLALRAARLITSVETALTNEGGAFSVHLGTKRQTALENLDRASRRALEAALSTGADATGKIAP